MATITEYRAGMRAVLATSVDPGTWTDALLDAGLRRALHYLAEHGPPAETTLACVARREQDLSGVAGLLGVAAVGWPWVEAEAIFRHVRWRWAGLGVVSIEGGVPAEGDALRLRYWVQQQISGLDGAAATTVPAALREALVTGAAGYVLLQRLRQVGEHPAPPLQTGRLYTQIAGDWVSVLAQSVHRWANAAPGASWGSIGL